MDVEVCATCGCTEFAHMFGGCDASCPDDCDGSHPDDDERVECECGSCDEAVWLENPDEVLCECGCPEEEHEPEPLYDIDDDDSDQSAADAGAAALACFGCHDCSEFVEGVTRAERAAGVTERPPGPTTLPIDLPHRITVSGFDEPLAIVAALVADHDGRPVRRDGVPARGAGLFVVYATTDDDLEIALTGAEVVSAARRA